MNFTEHKDNASSLSVYDVLGMLSEDQAVYLMVAQKKYKRYLGDSYRYADLEDALAAGDPVIKACGLDYKCKEQDDTVKSTLLDKFFTTYSDSLAFSNQLKLFLDD